jgi:predicted DNA-binding antitoxin AbrB/MazE fold protein
MPVITVEAIYKDGVLKPKTKLDLPEGTSVEVTVTMLPMQPVSESPFASLRGIWHFQYPISDRTGCNDLIKPIIHEIRAESSRKLDRMVLELKEALEALGTPTNE